VCSCVCDLCVRVGLCGVCVGGCVGVRGSVCELCVWVGVWWVCVGEWVVV
jgi:hypothetical protein